jgi:YVTN family beta-propeller protein
MKYLSTLLICASFWNANAQTHQLTKIWETDSLAVPESVLPSFKDKILYTSLIDGTSTEVDGKGGIAKVDLNGKIVDAQWTTGLNAPKGLGRSGNKLYVADLTEVAVIDMTSGKVEAKIPVQGSIFLNDVTVDKKGIVYVSDTRAAKVYRIENNKAELWLDSVKSANGLKAIGNDLYVLAGPTLIKVNQKKEITTVAQGFAKGGDGLEQLKNGDFIVSCWSGLIYYVSAKGQIELLLDTKEKMNTADFGLDADKNILYVPTFNKKSIIAYQLK